MINCNVILLLILSQMFLSNISSLVRVCPVEKQWLDFRHGFICNYTINCHEQNETLEKLYKSSVIIIHKGQWTVVNKMVENLSICGIKNVVLNPDFNLNDLDDYCSRREPGVIIPMMDETFDFIEMSEHLDKCEFENVTVSNYLYHKISPKCSNMRWIIGPKACSNVTVPKGIVIQNLFNDTYWDDEGRKVLVQNKTLKVGTVISSPFMTKTMVNGHFEYGGIAHELLTTISRQVGFKYTKSFEIMESAAYGNGLVAMLKDMEIDFAAASLTITEERSEIVDFTTSFYYEEIGIMINRQMDENQADFWKMFSLFPYTVWIAILVTTFVSMAMLYGLHKFAAIKLTTLFMEWTHCCWYIFSSMLNQQDMSPQTWSIQNFLTFFWLYAFAILSMYSGGLIAMLTSSRISVPFNSLEGLAEAVKSGQFRVCTIANSAFHSMLMNATLPSYKILFDFLNKNKKYLATEEYCIKLLSSSNDVAYLDEMTRLKELQIIHCSTKTKFVILDETFFPGNLAFATPKSSPLLSILTYQIIDAIEAGMIIGWKANYSEHQHFCTLATPNQVVNHIEDRISVYELGGPFVLLFVGLCMSILVFCIELYKIFYNKRKRSKIIPSSASSAFSLRSSSRNSSNFVHADQIQASLLSQKSP